MTRIALLVTAVCPAILSAGEPLVSGLKSGQRPGPYSSVVCTGPERGKLHCFVCEAADRPVAIVLARKMSDPLGKLVQGLDKALQADKELRSWVTFLYDDQTAVDADVVKWGKTHGIRNVPLAVFEDPDGPPAYRLSKAAEVTVLLAVKQKVVKNFSFRAGALTEAKAQSVLQALPEITGKK